MGIGDSLKEEEYMDNEKRSLAESTILNYLKGGQETVVEEDNYG